MTLDTHILRRPEVLSRLHISHATLYRMVARGEFPRPVRLGPRAVGWFEAEVGEWLVSRERAGSWTRDDHSVRS